MSSAPAAVQCGCTNMHGLFGLYRRKLPRRYLLMGPTVQGQMHAPNLCAKIASPMGSRLLAPKVHGILRLPSGLCTRPSKASEVSACRRSQILPANTVMISEIDPIDLVSQEGDLATELLTYYMYISHKLRQRHTTS